MRAGRGAVPAGSCTQREHSGGIGAPPGSTMRTCQELAYGPDLLREAKARPLKRVIQKYVQDPLAEMVLAGKIHDGETVKITAGKDGLMFNGAAVKQKAA